MGPLTKIVFVGLACLVILFGALGIRACSRTVFHRPQHSGAAQEEAVRETADPILAVSNLTDFNKLTTLDPKTRAVNPRIKKTLYWLYVSEKQGIGAIETLEKAFRMNGNINSPKSNDSKKQMVANFLEAKAMGLFTADRLSLLKRGQAVSIATGQYAGELVEIDHIVPLSRYPEFANDLRNLQLLSFSQNRSKGDRIGTVEFEKLRELQKP